MNKIELENYFKKIRDDFPILKKKYNNINMIYVDNAATSQKPIKVIDSISNFYKNYNANVHRGINFLSNISTDMFENSRDKVANFIGTNRNNIVFTKNATDSINIVANGLFDKFRSGDEIIVSVAEHHANLVVWQEICKLKNLKLKFINLNEDYEIDLNDLKKQISSKTKLVAINYVSNVLGSINDIEKISMIVRENSNAFLLVDGSAQIPHKKINLKKLDIDFYVFSAHKILGPTGVGILSGKKESLENLKPNSFGGSMIEDVTLDKSTFRNVPYSLEAGTANIESVVGFGFALDYINEIGFENIEKYEFELTKYFLKKVKNIKNITIYGKLKPENRVPIFSFNISNIHSHDISEIFNQNAIVIRAGHHCAMPLHNQILNIVSSNRISFSFYNTKEEIDKIVNLILKIEKIFKKGDFLLN